MFRCILGGLATFLTRKRADALHQVLVAEPGRLESVFNSTISEALGHLYGNRFILAELGWQETTCRALMEPEVADWKEQRLPQVVYLVGLGVRTKAEDTPLSASLLGGALPISLARLK